MNKKKGFTLLELIIVVTVIGVLAAILIPVFANVINKANAKAALSDARNTVTQYINDAADNGILPKNILIMVWKAGDFYLYGYNTTMGGELQVSAGNPYKCNTLDELMAEVSFNAKHPTERPESGQEYAIDTDGAFWLVPYYGAEWGAEKEGRQMCKDGDTPIKGTPVKTELKWESWEDETYRYLTAEMSEVLGKQESEDTDDASEVMVWHGMLSGDTYESGGEAYDPITPPETYEVIYNIGNLNVGYTATAPANTVENKGTPVIVNAKQPIFDNSVLTFEGWYTAADGGEPVSSVVINTDDDTPSVTVYAHWSYKAQKYNVTFDGNGGELNLAALEGWSNGEALTVGTDITNLVADSTAAKNGSDFIGWKSSVTGSIVSGTITVTENVTFVAQWTDITYDITFEAGEGGTGSYIVDNKKANDTFALPTAEEAGISRTGYLLSGWKQTSPAGSTYRPGATYTVLGNATMTAQWVKNEFTVVYVLDETIPSGAAANGIGITFTGETDKKYDVGTSEIMIEEAILPTYISMVSGTANAYTVSSTNGTIANTIITFGASLNVSGAQAGEVIYLTPTWIEMTVNISYEASVDGTVDNATGLPASHVVNITDNSTVSGTGFITTCALSNAEPTRPGYTFNGWEIKTLPSSAGLSNGSITNKTLSFNGSKAFTSNVTIVIAAKWSGSGDITYNVQTTLYDRFNNRSVSSNETQTLSITLPSDVTSFTLTNANIGDYLIGDYGLYDLTNYFESTQTFTLSNGTISPATTTINVYPYKYIDSVEYVMIYTGDGLQNIHCGGTESGLARNYQLQNNITLSSSLFSTPIGHSASVAGDAYFFTGIFDGNNMNINGLSVDKRSAGWDYVGLFAANDGTVKNFTLTVSAMKGDMFVGAVCGQNNGIVEGVTVNLSNDCVRANYACCGGITGWNEGTVTNCHVRSTVAGATTNVAAGNGDTFTRNTFSDGTEYYGVFVGGVAGLNFGNVTRCSTGNSSNGIGVSTMTYDWVTYDNPKGFCIGGIVGINDGTVSECYTYSCRLNRHKTDYSVTYEGADTAGMQYVGGIVGNNIKTVENCWAYKTVATTFGNYGGIVGVNQASGTVKTSWVYMSGATSYATYSSSGYTAADFNIYDDVGNSLGTITNVAVDNAYFGARGTNYSSGLTNVMPTNFSSTYWQTCTSRGPELINNMYRD